MLLLETGLGIIVVHGQLQVLLVLGAPFQILILVIDLLELVHQCLSCSQAHVCDGTEAATDGKALDVLDGMLHLMVEDIIDVRPDVADAP